MGLLHMGQTQRTSSHFTRHLCKTATEEKVNCGNGRVRKGAEGVLRRKLRLQVRTLTHSIMLEVRAYRNAI